jgi:type IX secretion system PorP/SprF family membrane protein
MMKWKLIIFVICQLLSFELFAQQLPEFSLIEQNQTTYNPGAIGNQEVLTANFMYRKNWTGFQGSPPSTQFFCAHAPLKNPDVALGILLEHDNIGATNTTGVYFNYAYRISLGMNRLAFGLRGGITNVSQDYTDLRQDGDPLFSEKNLKYTLPNFGFGTSFYGPKYWVGFSIPSLFSLGNFKSDKIRMKPILSEYEYCISGGAAFQINPDFSIDPSILVILSQFKTTRRLAINTLFTYKKAYSAGFGYRTGGDVIFLLEYSFNRQFSFAYSYDLEFGEINTISSGSHEINIFYKFGYKVNAANPRGF